MSHNESPIPPEFHQLMVNLLDDRLTDEQYARLMQWIHENAACRNCYVEQMVVHSLLILDHRDPLRYTPGPSAPSAIAPLLNMPGDWLDSLDYGSNEVGQTKMPPAHGFFTGLLISAIQRGSQILARPSYFTALILFFMVTPLVLFVFLDNKTEPPGVALTPRPLVARLIQQTADAKWVVSEGAILPGMDLPQGREIVLAKGVAKIEFYSGATVLLQGPATYRLERSNASFLQAGALAANVPQAASGFAVETPSATIVDLGTEFAVAVDAAGVTETHVFVGHVELTTRSEMKHEEGKPAKPRRQRLGAGEAVRIVATDTVDSVERIQVDPERFVHQLPAEKDMSPLPKFKVRFAHRGRKKPTSEGWGGWTGARDADLVLKPLKNDQGTAAWAIIDRSTQTGVRYIIERGKGLRPEIIAEGRTNGWILRARVKVISRGSNSTCHVAYRDDNRDWVLGFSADAEGNQTVHLQGESSLGVDASVKVPNSRNAYVDYEVRYDPKTNDASVYVSGSLLATRFFAAEATAARSLDFGTGSETEAEMRAALIEWGTLENRQD